MIVTTTGSIDIAAGRDAVWRALHDVDCLGLCVPGCSFVSRRDDGGYGLSARVRFGPVRVVFDGVVAVVDGEEPRRLCLSGQGRGGRAGCASGVARITLHERAGGCRLVYEIEAQVEGPIARLGPRMLAGIATGLSTMFGRRFARLLETPVPYGWRRGPSVSSRPTISRSA